MDDFEHREQEYRELNNELVVPQYDSLCRELGWNALFDAPVETSRGRRRLEYHNEAMNLFNRLKPEYVVFKNNIVWYQFTEWGGRFAYEVKPAALFLNETADKLYYLQCLEKRFMQVRMALATVATIGMFAALAVATNAWLPPELRWLATLPQLAVALATGSWLDRRLARVPRAIAEDGRFRDTAARALVLQQEATAGVADAAEPRSPAAMPAPDGGASDDELLDWVNTLRARVFSSPEANRSGT
jgi:hypothetical protein